MIPSPRYPAWVYLYLAKLGQPLEAPSLGYLGRLTRAHLTTRAFENISKLFYYKNHGQTGWFIPDIETFTENMYTMDVGGTCFTVNSNYQHLLKTIGFDAHLVAFSGNHMGIAVHLHDRLYYLDVGVGAPLFDPIDLDQEDVSVVYCGTGIRFRKQEGQPGTYLFDHLAGDQSIMQWTFDPHTPRTFADFTDKILIQNTPGQTFFMDTLRCRLWQPERGRSIALINNTLNIRYENGLATKTVLSSLEEIEAVLAYEFGLPKLPVREAHGVLQGLGVDIFAAT